MLYKETKVKNWENLKSMLCPECSYPIQHDNVFEKYFCSSYDCSFKISDIQFDKLLAKMYRPKRAPDGDEVEENLSALNNL